MAHIIREDRAESKSQIAIYVIQSPFDDSVYINKCAAHRLRETYKEHYNLRKKATADLFEKAKKESLKPPMYLLQSLECSQRIALRYCVAWANLCVENGFALIANEAFKDFVDDLVDDTKDIYKSISEHSLEDIMDPEKSLFPTYASTPRKVKGSTPKTIHFYVKPHEYIGLKNAAEESGLSLAAYCKQRALRNKIVEIDLSFLADYLNEFSEDKLLLRQIMFAIYSKGEYSPADLQNIQGLVDHLTKLQKEVQVDIQKILDALKE